MDKDLDDALELINTLVAELWGIYDKPRAEGAGPHESNEAHFKDYEGDGNPAAALNDAEALFKRLGRDLWAGM